MSNPSDCAKSISAMVKEWTQPVLAGGINIPPNLIDRRMALFEPSPALAALAMRERAAAYMENPTHQGIRPTWPSDIRALPTTFTDAELLAAAMQLPEVRALADIAFEAKTQLENRAYEGVNFYTGETRKYYGVRLETWSALCAALAPFKKGAS